MPVDIHPRLGEGCLDALSAFASDSAKPKSELLEQYLAIALAGLAAQLAINDCLRSMNHRGLPARCISILTQARSAGLCGQPFSHYFHGDPGRANPSYDIQILKTLGYIEMSTKPKVDRRKRWYKISADGLTFLDRLQL